MHKKLAVIGFILIFLSVGLFSSDRERKEFYLKAVNEQDMSQKVVLLKEFIQKYGSVEDDFLRYVYIQLSDTAYKLKRYDDTITYGEKSLEFPDISGGNKQRVLFMVANAYHVTKQSPEKAIEYTKSMIQLTEHIIVNSEKANMPPEKRKVFIDSQKKFYILGGHRLLTLIIYEKAKQNPELLPDAAKKAVEFYKLDPNKNTARMVLSLANELYKKRKIKEAIAAVEEVTDENEMNERTANFLASMYYKDGNKTKAIVYYEKAYTLKKKVSTALKLGKLVYKKDLDKGIKFFADAFVMSNKDKGSDAYRYLQELYYNRKAKGLPQEEQDKGFRAIVEASQTRTGHTGS